MNALPHGLSVVMIAGNSEKYLSLVLRSLKVIASEFVLVDTGSTDGTVAIARKFGCRIFEFPWVDDFAKAKNFGIDRARFSWILNVDTDEVLYDKKAGETIIAALQERDARAYIVWLDNLFDSGAVESVKGLRLFRNDPAIRFSNPVHESIGESLYAHWPELVPRLLDVHFRHYGYLSLNATGKHHRNIQLMQKWVTAQPESIFANYKLGTTLCEAGQKSEALPYLEKTFDLFARSGDRGSYPFLGAFIDYYCALLVELGEGEKALRIREVAREW